MRDKDKCLKILKDLRNDMQYWDWEEDYFKSGLENWEDRMNDAIEAMDDVIKTISNTEGENDG